MKHIPAQLSKSVYRCINCNQLLCDHNSCAFPLSAMIANITDDNCPLTCVEALIKELLE